MQLSINSEDDISDKNLEFVIKVLQVVLDSDGSVCFSHDLEYDSIDMVVCIKGKS